MSHIATKRQFARNLTSGWLLLVAEVLTAFFMTPFVINKLGLSTYGVWTLMVSMIGYMGLIDIGIRGSVGRYVNHYLALNDKRGLDEVVGTANVVLTGLSCIALVGSLFLAVNFQRIFPKTPLELLEPIRVCLPLMTVGLWFSFITSILGNLLSAREATYLTNQFSLVSLVLRTAGTVWALSAGHGLVALVLITLALSLFTLLISWLAARKVFGQEMPAMVLFSASRLALVWRYGVASFTSRTASTFANDSAPIIGMWILGPEAVGVYSVAMTLAQYGRRLMDQAGAAIFPSVMRAGALRNLAGLRSVFLRFMNISFAIGSLVYIGMMVYSQSFLTLWVGPSYAQGAWVVGILSVGYLMQSISSTSQLTLASLDRVNLTMMIGLAEAFSCVILTAVLPSVLELGLVGMALGSTLPRLAVNCLLYPSLAVSIMGEELKADMRTQILHNLLICVGVAFGFVLIFVALPGETWASLIAGSVLMTASHVLLLGGRYEVFGPIEKFQNAWSARLQRWGRRDE